MEDLIEHFIVSPYPPEIPIYIDVSQNSDRKRWEIEFFIKKEIIDWRVEVPFVLLNKTRWHDVIIAVMDRFDMTSAERVFTAEGVIKSESIKIITDCYGPWSWRITKK